MAIKLVSPKTQAANPTKYSTSQVSTALTGGLQKKAVTPTMPKTTQTAPQKFAEAREQSKAQGTQISTGKGYFDSGSYKVGTPTVISNKTVIDQVPKDIAKLNNLSQKGQISNGEAVYYPDGTMVGEQKPVQNTFGKEDYANTPEYKLLEQMRSSLDASTSSQIAQIQKQLQMRRDETNAINATQAKAMENSLLMGGATGSGSSAQYAPISSEGIMSAQENYRMKQIQELDNQEMQLIESAKAAQQSGNYQILSQQIQLIGKLREQKQEETAKLNETIAEQNNKLREQVYQQQKDQSISELYSQGITDVASIVEATGLPSKEVAETLKNLVPVGLDDLVESLKNNGAPSSVMQKVINSKNLSEAYMNAGSWGAEGTGKVAEYNLYKAQAEDSGVAPLGYQGWVDYNENQQLARQKALKGTQTGAQRSSGGGSKSSTSTTVRGGTEAIQKYTPTINAVANMETTVSGRASTKAQMEQLIANGDYESAYMQIANGVENKLQGTTKNKFADARTDYEVMGGMEEAINEFTRMGGDMGLLQGTEERIKKNLGIGSGKETELATQLWREFQTYRSNMTGAAFSPQESRDYASVNPTLGKSLDLNLSVISGARKQLENRIDSTIDARVPKASEIRKLANDTPANQLIQQQKQNQDALYTYLRNNPDKQNEVAGQIDKLEKKLGRELSADEFLVYFPEYQ